MGSCDFSNECSSMAIMYFYVLLQVNYKDKQSRLSSLCILPKGASPNSSKRINHLFSS